MTTLKRSVVVCVLVSLLGVPAFAQPGGQGNGDIDRACTLGDREMSERHVCRSTLEGVVALEAGDEPDRSRRHLRVHVGARRVRLCREVEDFAPQVLVVVR